MAVQIREPKGIKRELQQLKKLKNKLHGITHRENDEIVPLTLWRHSSVQARNLMWNLHKVFIFATMNLVMTFLSSIWELLSHCFQISLQNFQPSPSKLSQLKCQIILWRRKRAQHFPNDFSTFHVHQPTTSRQLLCEHEHERTSNIFSSAESPHRCWHELKGFYCFCQVEKMKIKEEWQKSMSRVEKFIKKYT